MRTQSSRCMTSASRYSWGGSFTQKGSPTSTSPTSRVIFPWAHNVPGTRSILTSHRCTGLCRRRGHRPKHFCNDDAGCREPGEPEHSVRCKVHRQTTIEQTPPLSSCNPPAARSPGRQRRQDSRFARPAGFCRAGRGRSQSHSREENSLHSFCWSPSYSSWVLAPYFSSSRAASLSIPLYMESGGPSPR